ncbi:MAG: LON peptidase substrate-binding domain-containing protein [Thermoanaerobaculia bacterium]|nr:LON peptidase substrate-binding domain-containing protein [Thermoanaerobaculia bacterium]
MTHSLEPIDLRAVHRLPLFPLSDEVHFPHTELRLHVVDSEYCTLVQDLFLRRGREAHVGMVLLRPGYRGSRVHPPVFADGTAARVLEVEEDTDGVHVVVHGETRFHVEKETGSPPCREALVRWVDEPSLSETDPEIQSLRRELLETTTVLAGELGEGFRLHDHLMELEADLPFEAVVNHMAANVDVGPLRKLQLLRDAVPERALRLLTILRHRCQVLDVLRPYRHLEPASARN